MTTNAEGRIYEDRTEPPGVWFPLAPPAAFCVPCAMSARWLLGLVVALVVVSGCKPKPKAKYVIAVIPKGRTHEFWQSIERGARRAAADLTAAGVSVEILFEGPSTKATPWRRSASFAR